MIDALPALPPSSEWTQSFQNVLIAIPATIFALAALMAARKGNVKADKAIAQNVELVKTTDQIQSSTDGNLTRITEELKLANEKMQRMDKMIALLEQKWGRGPAAASSDVELARDADATLAKFKEEHERANDLP